MFTTMPSSNHTHTTLTAVEQFILSREKQKPRLRLIQRPGTDMPDTIHTPTDTDTDTDIDILMPMEDIPMDIITANKFSDEYRISDMAKKGKSTRPSHTSYKIP